MVLPWTQSEKDILSAFGVDLNRGLSREEALLRIKTFGPNLISFDFRQSKLKLFLKQFISPVFYILGLGIIVSFVLGRFWDGSSIAGILLINVFISYVQESKAQDSVLKLSEKTRPQVKVLRDGIILSQNSSEIVPGDILLLEAGDYIVADARVLFSHQLTIDESSFTGESAPILKDTGLIPEETRLFDRSNMLLSNTFVSAGNGKALVVATGASTEAGKIASLMAVTKSESTPLQKRLEKVTQKLILLAILVMFLVMISGLLRHLPLNLILMEAIGLTVAAIPEGLPTVVTLSLVMAVSRMSKKNALIRHLPSVETLGSTDVICSDKTGTLTTGNMQVTELYLADSGMEKALEIMALCNNASPEQVGFTNSTEVALLKHVQLHASIPDLRSRFTRLTEWNFDNQRKRMSVAVEAFDHKLILLKGAPESVFSCCLLNADESIKIKKKLESLSAQGMRVLALAYKDIAKRGPLDFTALEIEKDMILVGLVALSDPLRKESLQAVKKCQKAGIRVIMITGDHPLTARSVALDLGILNDLNSIVFTGSDIENLSSDELQNKIMSVSVFARVTPEQKFLIVSCLEKLGHTVAMTGDGINDGPALKKASIGIAMGKKGTEVARQASDMVLTDDNFSTIVDAIEEGRAIHDNISRTLQYLLSTNLAEILVVLGSAILGMPSPINPLCILWINLVTDGLPSIALATEKVAPHYLQNSFRPSAESFFNQKFYTELVLVAGFITLMTLIIFQYGLANSSRVIARTYVFNFMVYVILLRSFSSRSINLTIFQLPSNWLHFFAVLIPLLLQLFLPQFSFTRGIFNVEFLTMTENALLFVLALVPLIFLELKKLTKLT